MTVTAASPRLVTFEVSLLAKPSQKILSSLDEGVPTHVAYTVELWQERSHWFDRLVHAEAVEFALTSDPWSGEYRMGSVELSDRSFADREELAGWLEAHGPLELALEAPLAEDHAYFVAVSARIAPLSAEQVDAVEDWLGGRRPDSTGEGGEDMGARGSGGGLKGHVLGFILNLSGLGELGVSGRSSSFRVGPAGPTGDAGG